ncbi:MAG: aldo/keto reductase [Litorilinea sp.]
MDFVTLGRTGLRVSVIGLGCGGPSRLGMATGKSEAESVAVVRKALDLGVNFIDTAHAYGTEPIVGKALAGVNRDDVILSTKKNVSRDNVRVSGTDMVTGVEESLQRLGVDYLDIFHLHGVRFEDYEYAATEIVPQLQRLRQDGKIRWLGITENFSAETRHEMLIRALQDDFFDVMMVGFNMLNHSARNAVFPQTIAKNIGVLIMFAVRRTLSNPDQLRTTMQELVADGLVDAEAFDADDPLGFLTDRRASVEGQVAESLTEAAYRYCRYEPGAHVVLSGTGSVQHLAENAEALSQPPLPPAHVARVNDLFARVDTVSGN